MQETPLPPSSLDSRSLDSRSRTGGSLPRLALALLALAPLAGCATSDRLKVSAIASDDYKVRHPIVLAQDQSSIDVFPPRAGALDRHTAKQIVTFGDEYLQRGQGPILVLLPRGSGVGDGRQALASIRAVLARSGVRARLTVSTYPVADPRLASPVRLSFGGLAAKVVGQCGEWPSDLGSASSVAGWENRQYYNFGCATQSMIAAQAADPRDLVTPRGEEPADTLIRSHAIESLRLGQDPATNWTLQGTNIGSVGGGS